MTVRNYSSRSQQTTLSTSVNASATTITVGSASNLLGGVSGASLSVTSTFTIVIDPDTALEEIVDVTGVSGNVLTIVRGIETNPATGQAHGAGAVIRHMVTGRDLRESNDHSNGTLAQHVATTSSELRGIISDETGTGALVFANTPTLVTPVLGVATATSINGTTIPSSATLLKASDTNIISSAMITNNAIVDEDINASAAIAWTKIAPSSTVSATELGYLDGVTSAIQTQIDSKLATATASSTYAPLASPALTGTPTAPTATAGTSTTQVATTAFVGTAVSNLVASAPSTLDTLNELATALGNDAAFSTTVTNSIAAKLPLAGGTMTGAIAMGTNKVTGLGTPSASTDAATKGYVDTVTVAPSNLTGPITSVGSATAIASQTGTGTKFVVDTSPTLVTPVLGVATATSINSTIIPTSKTLVATDSTAYVVPSQTGNSGKYLTTDGTTSSWGAVNALPSQTGNSGKYLTTNGTAASWATITTDPTPTVFMLMGA